ncbi:class I SAM-dependent methyltransferase [Rhabdaerophilum calidifontis]|uniref:class I SAM-dependent methyltransferase n=1 Tax=Rhabdaerophilum calidifontis TaxID=2604328 RepID=UPI001238C1AD|nr:class I SAM-dependent methyltransferase [Rhabdaerophilum calidifontis]
MAAHHDLSVGTLTCCQVCNSTRLQPVIDLGHQPPCDSLLWPHQRNEPETSYPLRLFFCEDCSLVQIDHVVAPEVLFFPDYPYRSGITATLVEKLSRTAQSTLGRFQVEPGSLVIDIGSNDGTVLSAFKQRGMRVLGVEATNIAQIANQSGIETLQAFFDETVAARIVRDYGHASVMTATNVFAHVAGLGTIMRGVSALLEDGGVFVTESHYILDLIETLQYDSIYHEHLRYYSLKSIIRLFEQYDFTVADVERIDNYGGSIRVFAVKGRGRPVSDAVRDLLATEREAGLYEGAVYQAFAERVRRSRRDLLAKVLEIRAAGHTLCGIGCPGRSSTLLNYVGIDPDLMPYIAEQSSSLKLGLFLPGMHIPIVDEERMFREQPDYALMLSWHYARPIIAKLRQRGLRSKIILPLPEVTIDIAQG